MNPFFSAPCMTKRLYAGPLGPHIDAFAAFLRERGYARRTGRTYVRLAGDFSRWLDERRLRLRDFHEPTIKRFIRHQRRRDCTQQKQGAILRLLLGQLRQAGVLLPPPASKEDGLCHGLEREYAQHLTEDQGLSHGTLLIRLPIIRRFLAKRFPRGPVRPGDLEARDITAFILHRARTVSPATAKHAVTALRSFFRFLRFRGHIATDLAGCVPAVAHWRFSTLPKALRPEEVRRLLRSCDRNTVLGRRDHAILLLLARLGLRAGEVVALTLDDVDWEAGELTVHGKGSQEDRLPLPGDVGGAMVGYLRHGRPSCPTRRVFIRMRAPHQGLSSSVAVWNIVRRALERCGLCPPHRGAHLLRHSLATEMLRRKASLAEIGEILRHRDLQTTQIYAKVDVTSLGALAHPWPGGVR